MCGSSSSACQRVLLALLASRTAAPVCPCRVVGGNPERHWQQMTWSGNFEPPHTLVAIGITGHAQASALIEVET